MVVCESVDRGVSQLDRVTSGSTIIGASLSEPHIVDGSIASPSTDSSVASEKKVHS